MNGGHGRPAYAAKKAQAPLQRKPAKKAIGPHSARSDAHERQADRAARSFVAGESNLAQRLTPAAPASYALRDSRAQVLPYGLRQELEAAFDADFSAVRIHADAVAADAVRRHHARAFAAGAHIYFGQGEFDPGSNAGRELIAHELAHTLQQGGRRSDGPSWSVADIGTGAGSGAVQCAPNAMSLAAAFKGGEILQPANDAEDCKAAVDRHLASYKGGVPADVQAMADKIKAQVDGKTIEEAVNVIDSLYADLAPADRSDPLKRMVFDAYKSLNAHDDAKTMIGDTPDMTASGRWDYYTAYLRGDASWVPALLKSHPVAKNYYPNALVSVAKFDFYGLTRGVLNLDPNLQFFEKMNAALTAAYTYDPLMPNERTASALTAFFVFDIIRKAPFRDLETVLKGEKSLVKRAAVKRKLIKLYIEPAYLSDLVRKTSADPEVQIIADEVGALLAPIAARADRYWESIAAFTSVVLTNSKDEKALEQAKAMRGAIQQQFPQIKEFKDVEARLVKVLELAAKTGNKGKLPTARQLDANIDAASRAIGSLINELDQSLVRREKKLLVSDIDTKKPADAPAQDGQAPATAETAGTGTENVTQDMVYGAVLYLMFELQGSLVHYAAPAGAGTQAGDMEGPEDPLLVQDHLVARYMHNAEMFLKVGQIVGLKTLAEKANAVYYAQQGGLQESHVGLLAQFSKKDSSLEDFSTDFPKGERNTSVLSGADLTQFVFTVYYEGLLKQLDAALTAKNEAGLAQEFDYSHKDKPLINVAIDATNAAFKPPRKYMVPHEATVLYVKPGDEQDVASLLPRQHPMLKALVAAELGQNDDGFIPRKLSAHADGFVVWFIPDMDILAARLAAIPGVVDLLLADGTPLGQPSAYDKPRDWLAKLDEAVKIKPEWQETLKKAVDQGMDTALAALDAPLRRATSNHRNMMRIEIAAAWEMLAKPDVGRKVDTYFEPPRRAINLMERFARDIQPHTVQEQQLQMTVLLLELVPLLTRKLGVEYLFGEEIRIGGTQRLDIVLPLYGYLEGAAVLAGSGSIAGDVEAMQPDFPLGQLAARAAQLQKLARDFKDTAQSVQASTVLAGSAGENMLHVPDRGYAVIASDDSERNSATFQIDGVQYTLLQVHRDFQFEPGLVTKPAVMKWNDDDLGKSRLWIDGKEAGAGDQTPLLTIMRKTDDQKTAVKVVIKAGDRALLSELTYAVHMNIVMRQLQDLQQVLEVYASVMTTMMQVAFPEAAPYIAYAEISGSMLQFFSGPEFAQIQVAFDSDSGAFFGDVLDKFKKELTFENLWNYLLFDDVPPILQPLRTLMDVAGHMKSLQSRPDPETQSASGKVFGRIKKAGILLAQGVDKTKERMSYPVRAAELYVAGSPTLILLLRFIAHNMHLLDGLNLRDLGVDKLTDLIEQAQQFYQRFEKIVDGLSTYELPEELVPLEALVEMVANFLVDRLPLKYRVFMKGAKKVERTKPVFKWMYGVAADELRKASLDPNILWRDYARKEINPFLTRAAREVADEVHALMAKVPLLHTLAHMKAADIIWDFGHGVVPAEGDGVPSSAPDAPSDTQPKLAPGVGGLAAAPMLPSNGGAPMPREMLQRAHSGFGHDFSHVRLHRGAAVDAGLRSANALAATSGSHVYLDRNLPLQSAGGRDVVHHELAHVLQQTGQRPLSRRHSSMPMAGRSGAGWRVDRHAESQADSLAAQSRRPASGPRPVSAAHGVQPALADVVGNFFSKLADPGKLVGKAQEMIDVKPKKGQLDAAAPGLRDTLGPSLVDALKTYGKPKSPVSVSTPFDAMGADFVDYLLNNRKGLLVDSMPGVLMQGLQEITKKKPKNASKSQPPETFMIIDRNKVETALEEFFFGISGISVDVEFNTKDVKDPDDKVRPRIDTANPFAKLQIRYVHLPLIGTDAELWRTIIKNTYPKFKNDELTLYKSKARLALMAQLPGPDVFETVGKGKNRKLVFKKEIKELIEHYVHPPADTQVPGNHAPKWKEYIDTDPVTKPGPYGQIGLRLGFYKDRADITQQNGTDRNSHHTVQYLLLEYLVNSKDRHKPFPHKLNLYPNVVAQGNAVKHILDAPGGSNKIDILENEDGRGGNMPAILLSAHAHSTGDVHVTAKPDDMPTGDPPSQGAAINNEFRKHLGDYREIATGDVKHLQQMAKNRSGKQAPVPVKLKGNKLANDADLSEAIYNASHKTYTWMRNDMNKKLQKALGREEMDYYKDLVSTATDVNIYDKNTKTAGSDYTPTDASTSLMAKVKTKQKEALQDKFGFKEMP